MNLKNVKNSVVCFVSKSYRVAEKHSPEILCVAGVIGGVVGAVMACKASTKITEVVEDTKTALEAIDAGAEIIEIHGEDHTVKEHGESVRFVYLRTAWVITKMYGPALIVGGMSIASIFASNNILRKRTLAIGAAYATLDKSFKDYRERVIERFGSDVDEELKMGVKAMKIEETVVDPETGKEKKVKKTVKVTDANLASPWAEYFDHRSLTYDRNNDFNLCFLGAQETYLTNKLGVKGWISYNDIMEAIDMPYAFKPEGQYFGVSKNGPDGYVNLRAKIVQRINEDGTVEDAIVIDPNIEGDILNKI